MRIRAQDDQLNRQRLALKKYGNILCIVKIVLHRIISKKIQRVSLRETWTEPSTITSNDADFCARSRS